MNPAVKLCLIASGIFFMAGLLTGTWKYLSIRASPENKAHHYINVAHQAALAYSFASLVLAKFAEYSPYSTLVTLGAAALALFHFAFAIITYIIHGITKDTTNQFRTPHTLGPLRLPKALVHTLMWALVVSEIGGSGVLFWGFLESQAM